MYFFQKNRYSSKRPAGHVEFTFDNPAKIVLNEILKYGVQSWKNKHEI